MTDLSNRLKRGLDPTTQLNFGDLLGDVHSALTTKDRMNVLSRIEQLVTEGRDGQTLAGVDPLVACRLLIEGDILPALLLQFNYVLKRHGSTVREIEQLQRIFHLLMRICPGEVKNRVIVLLERQEFVDLLSKSVQHHPMNGNLVGILHSLSGSANGSSLIVKCRPLLLRLIDSLNASIENSIDSLVLEALGCLKNVTFYAEVERPVLLSLPGFTSALCSTCAALQSASEKVSERLSAVIRNLALSPECRLTIGRDPRYLNALLELVSHQNNPRVLRNVLNILHSLSMENDVNLLLVLHGDGMLLNVLKRLLVEDEDSVIRRRSARTFRLLTNEASAPLMVRRADVMALLSNCSLQDENHAVRCEAAEAFSKCAGLVHPRLPHFNTVIDAVIRLSKSPGIPLEVLGRALRDQSFSPDNRLAIGQNPALVRILADIAQSFDSPEPAREDACCAFSQLSEEDEIRSRLCADELRVLNALVCNAQGPAYDQSKRRKYAVQALVNLCALPANRNVMASHDLLLKTLLQFAAMSTDSKLKGDVKHSILMLVKEL